MLIKNHNLEIKSQKSIIFWEEYQVLAKCMDQKGYYFKLNAWLQNIYMVLLIKIFSYRFKLLPCIHVVVWNRHL